MLLLTCLELCARDGERGGEDPPHQVRGIRIQDSSSGNNIEVFVHVVKMHCYNRPLPSFHHFVRQSFHGSCWVLSDILEARYSLDIL